MEVSFCGGCLCHSGRLLSLLRVLGIEPHCEGILMAFAAILGVTELALNGCNPVGYEWRCCGVKL